MKIVFVINSPSTAMRIVVDQNPIFFLLHELHRVVQNRYIQLIRNVSKNRPTTQQMFAQSIDLSKDNSHFVTMKVQIVDFWCLRNKILWLLGFQESERENCNLCFCVQSRSDFLLFSQLLKKDTTMCSSHHCAHIICSDGNFKFQ
jgi:hypothetical protein